jgi:hypothetical protein
MAAPSARLWLRPPRWSPMLVGLGTTLGELLLWRELTSANGHSCDACTDSL